MEIRWDHLSEVAWARGLEGSGAPMQQHWTYGETVIRMGARVRRAEILDPEGDLAGLAQVLFRGPLALVSRGPVWARGVDAVAQARGLRALARASGRVLIATPDAPVPGAGLALITPRHVAEIDLIRPVADLRAGLSGKWRNRLVAAEAAGMRIRRSDRHPADYAWLLEVEQAQRRARGYKALPSRFVADWQAVAPRGLRVWEAWKEDRPVAAMLFILHPPHASYYIGWAGDQGRATHAHNLILWQAMAALAGEGITALDLGLVETDTAPGLARFKIGTGACVRSLGATLLVPPFAPLFSRHLTRSPANSLR